MTDTLVEHRRTPRRRARRQLLVGLLAMLFTTFVPTAPAGAHTALLETVPANRSSLETAPETLTFSFAEAVDPRSVTLTIVSAADGAEVPGAVRVTPDSPDSAVIEFELPALAPGVYGMPWVTVGPDGHRVAGEVVVGIGDSFDASALATASFSSTSGGDRALEILNGVGRVLWYLGLAMVAGGLVALWIISRDEGANVFASAARRSLGLGAKIVVAGVWIRSFTTLTVLAVNYDLRGTTSADFVDAATTKTGWYALASVLLALVVWWASRSVRDPIDPVMLGAIGTGVLAIITASVANGHTVVLSELPFEIVGATLHVAAAALWVGPILVIALALRSAAFAELPSADRADALGRYFKPFTMIAFVTFGVLTLTGFRASWLNVFRDGGESVSEYFSGVYGATLAAKLLLIALVIVPLGWRHDRAVRWRNRGEVDPDDPAPTMPLTAPRFARSLRLETGAMLVVLLFAALLTGATPSILTGDLSGSGTAAALLSDGPVEDVSACVDLEVGRPNCYRSYFKTILETQDASAAVAEVLRLSTTDDYVMIDCHQVSHDLGNDALVHYGDIGTALTYEGSACWSGYYHGVVEFALSELGPDNLIAEVPAVCASPLENDGEYSFSHYNCVHGVGHGVMLQLEANLRDSLNVCTAYEDSWERSSCVGGVFMENVVSAQTGFGEYDMDENDLIYPCNTVDDEFADDCFRMQTSYILWKNGYDYKSAFELCNSLPERGLAEDLVYECYASMGRDISGNHLQDLDKVIEYCNQGLEPYQYRCWEGAALNALYNDAAVARAHIVCDVLEGEELDRCYQRVDGAAARIG